MHGGHGFGMHGGGSGEDGGSFGVRRPLRFLAYRLSLDERQTAEVARILDELKTERAQVGVDERRTISSFADALEAEALDAAKLEEAASARVRSSERLKAAVVNALGRIHAVLDPEQRRQFAFLLRTGALQF
jgi:Spy/CpxP family protein refolding chaperone